MGRTHTIGRRAIALAVAGVVAGTGSTQAESLADAMVQAYNSSPELVAARGNVKIFAERAVQARAAGRVQVDGSIESTIQYFDLDEFRYPNTLSLTATYPLFTGGQVENTTASAETRITAEEARLLTTEQSVLLNTVIAYSDVLQDQTLVELGENNVRVIREQLRAARERFDVGEVTRTDVAQAEARLAAAQSLLVARTGQLQTSRENYKRVVGDYPQRLDPPPPLPDIPSNLDEAIAIASNDDPSLRAARLERVAAGTDVRAAIGALLPQIAVQGAFAHSDTVELSNDSRTNASVGLVISIPFYAGGANYSEVREQQAQVEARDGDVSTALRNAIQNVGIAWSDLDVARASIRAARLEIRAAEIAFEGVQEEAKVGARTTLDVLDAEQELLDARGDLVGSLRDEFVASFNVLFSIGKLTVDHMGLDVDASVDVADYYAAVREQYFGYDDTDETVWSLSYRP